MPRDVQMQRVIFRNICGGVAPVVAMMMRMAGRASHWWPGYCCPSYSRGPAMTSLRPVVFGSWRDAARCLALPVGWGQPKLCWRSRAASFGRVRRAHARGNVGASNLTARSCGRPSFALANGVPRFECNSLEFCSSRGWELPCIQGGRGEWARTIWQINANFRALMRRICRQCVANGPRELKLSKSAC